MSTTFINVAVIQAAEDACSDSRKRFVTGDRSVTRSELEAYGTLIGAAKDAGVLDPFAELVQRAMPVNLPGWRSQTGPLHGRRLTPITK